MICDFLFFDLQTVDGTFFERIVNATSGWICWFFDTRDGVNLMKEPICGNNK